MRRLPANKYSLAALLAALDLNIQENRLQKRVRVVIADTPRDALESSLALASRDYKVIAAYSFLTTLLPDLLIEFRALLPKLREHGVLTVAGGPHPSGDPLGTLNLGFDLVVVGDGEESFPSIVNELAEGGDPYGVRGIVYWTEGADKACFTGRSVVMIDRYPNFPYWRGIYAPIELTRGCNYACLFCQVSFTQGGRLRHRSIERVEEMASALIDANRRDLRFITPNAFSYLGDGRKPRVEAICELLERLSSLARRSGGARIFLGSFPSEIRPEHAAVEDAVRCIAGKVANRRIIIGAQSGSERMLKLMNRGHGVSEVISAVETLNKYGFLADVDIIVGFPGEEPADLEETVRLSELLVSRYRARIHAHFYLPLPGTPIHSLEPSEPSEQLLRRLFKLMGRGKLYGEWLRQRELSRTLVSLYKKGVIVGLRGWTRIKRCSGA